MNVFRFTSGPKILVDFGNRILDEVQASTVISSTSVKANRSPGGTILSAAGGSLSSSTHPYTVSDASSGSTPKVGVTPGTHNGFMPQIDGAPLIPPVTMPVTPAPTLTLDTSAAYVYVQFDFSYNANNQMTILDGSINSTDSTVPVSTLTPGTGGGTGSFYEPLAAVQVKTSSSGSVSVTVYQLVTTIRTIYICGGAVTVVTS